MSEINIDSEALKSRIAAHDKLAEKDINDWIFELSEPETAGNTLDIGCGTGKQLLPLSQKVKKGSSVIGIDLSIASLEYVEKMAFDKKIKNIITLKSDIDSFFGVLPISEFDLIQSCFAFYYSKDQVSLLDKLYDILSPSGRIFICGYNKDNNEELFSLHTSLVPNSKRVKPKPAFITDLEMNKAFRRYSNIETHEFTNRIFYDSVKSVLNYWKNYYLYDPSIETQLAEKLQEHFRNNSHFIVTKRVLGILANK